MSKYNAYYWEGKQNRADAAQKHTQAVGDRYYNEIAECVQNSKIFGNCDNVRVNECCAPSDKNIQMSVVRSDTVSALFDHTGDGRIALLNFASYKHPGGGFMVGSRAQEESLCHESFLYNVLREFEASYYNENRKDLNRGLYRDRAIYSPNVVFIRNGTTKICDVVTCAAPNFSVAEKFVSRGQNNSILRSRVRFILEIAKSMGVDTFIVGAWGCGGATRC